MHCCKLIFIDDHVIAACLEYCVMNKIDSPCQKIPTVLPIADPDKKRRVLQQLAGEIDDTYFLDAITINIDRID
jgi:hypothetical protein